jgi:hypothetical protein
MGIKKSELTLKLISGLIGQARIDALVDLLYSDSRSTLTDDQYFDLAWPDRTLVSDLYGAASLNEGAMEERSELFEPRWKCSIQGSSRSFARADYASKEVADVLKGILPKDRIAELHDGSPYTEGEWQRFRNEYEVHDSEAAQSVVTFETRDTLGRSMYFVAEFGDRGSFLVSFGPYSNGQDKLTNYKNSDDTVLVFDDECWRAWTPNWEEDEDDDGDTEDGEDDDEQANCELEGDDDHNENRSILPPTTIRLRSSRRI